MTLRGEPWRPTTSQQHHKMSTEGLDWCSRAVAGRITVQARRVKHDCKKQGKREGSALLETL